MKRTLFLLVLSLATNLFFTNALYADELVIYKAPYMAEAAPEFLLEVNGRPVFVYNTRVAAYAYFSFEGKVDIKVTYGAANLWKMGANAIEIGFETRADTMKNITFRNIDIIHCEGIGYSTFSIHNGDRAFIKNVLFEDIRVEDLKEGWLIDFRILESVYSKDKTRGYVDNVRFKNINVESDFYPFSQIIGFDETHTIKNVILQNFRIHGRQTPGTITVVHADPVRYK